MRLIAYQSPSASWASSSRLPVWSRFLEPEFGRGVPGCSWLPPLDIYQNSEQVTVRLEAPGLKKEDFDLSLKDDTLTISGGRQADNDSAEAEDGRAARSVARFSRSVTLPSVVKADGVTAGYEDGVLTVTLPKAEEAKPRKIEVSIK